MRIPNSTTLKGLCLSSLVLFLCATLHAQDVALDTSYPDADVVEVESLEECLEAIECPLEGACEEERLACQLAEEDADIPLEADPSLEADCSGPPEGLPEECVVLPDGLEEQAKGMNRGLDEVLKKLKRMKKAKREAEVPWRD